MLCGTSLGEGRVSPQAFKTCSGSGATGHAAACLKCFSDPKRKNGPKALVQLAAQHAGRQASTLDFGEGRPAIRDDEIICYVTWHSKTKAGELICADCWDEGHRATLPEEIQDTIEEEEENIHELQQELQAGLIFCPPLGRVELADMDIMSRFLRLAEIEDSVELRLKLLRGFLTSLPDPSPLSHLADIHLLGDSDDTFNETKREDWARFTVAVQETIDETRLKFNPVATAHSAHSGQDRHRLPFPADLERFGQQAAIHLEHTMGVHQVNKLANDLSPQAQGALYMAGFNANAGSFSETQHLMLAKHIQRVLARVFT